MVATISARTNVASAMQYFTHLEKDDYYLKNEDEGHWHGRAADFLDLDKKVTREQFGLALQGRDPLTSTELIKMGKNSKNHQAGWDICLSAPKSVSVLWALAPDDEKKQAILKAHKNAVVSTCTYIENTYGICRRGKGGKIREKTAGLLFSVFNHKTSRSLCPQLHSHVFTFNMAPRKDSTWGAVLSKPFYSAQKDIGKHYRKELHHQLQRLNVPSRMHQETIKIDGIDRKTEMAFSIRRKQILSAMEQYGYTHTAEGFQKATLRTRQKKIAYPLPLLFKAWNERALQRGLKPDNLSPIWDNLKPHPMVKKQHTKIQLSKKFVSRLAKAAACTLKPNIDAALNLTMVNIKKASKALFDMVREKHQTLLRKATAPTRRR